jgi:hypothetical protein
VAKKQGRKPAKKTKARAAKPSRRTPKPARAAAPRTAAVAPAEDVSLSPVQQALARRRAALVARLAG